MVAEAVEVAAEQVAKNLITDTEAMDTKVGAVVAVVATEAKVVAVGAEEVEALPRRKK